MLCVLFISFLLYHSVRFFLFNLIFLCPFCCPFCETTYFEIQRWNILLTILNRANNLKQTFQVGLLSHTACPLNP